MKFLFEDKQHIVLFDKTVVLYAYDGNTWEPIDESIFTRYRKKNPEFIKAFDKTYHIKTELNTIIGVYKIVSKINK